MSEPLPNTFYIDVQKKRNNILVTGYHEGKRFIDRVPYKPYLFMPSKVDTEYKTLDDKPVSRIDFETMSEAREFYQKYSDIQNFNIYGLDQFIYTYIYDNYPGEIQYNPKLIKTWFIDIETSPTELDSDGNILNSGFPDVETANQEITAITIKLGKTYIAMGCGEYITNRSDVKYVKFKNEKELLRGLIRMFQDDNYRPDVITGWYSRFFDLPYIINRIIRVLGKSEANKISPWGFLNQDTIELGNRELQTYTIPGVASLDYMELYKKFTYNQQESYTLDHIAEIETGKKKLDYSEYESLADLYRQNYQKFLDYNIVDVERVYDIDQKCGLLDLVYAVAYDAKVNLADALTSVRLWDIIIHNYLMDQKIVVPQNTRSIDNEFIPGGFVKEPQIGMHEWVVSFDVQSMYPHAIMSQNISPETFVKRFNIELENHVISDLEQHKIKLQNAREYALKNNLSLAANGSLYTKNKIGVFPVQMKTKFDKRVEYKNKLKKYSIIENPSEDDLNSIKKFDSYQLAQKILINSLFGAAGNSWFRHYSTDNASAITVTGQFMIQWIQNAVNLELDKIIGIKKDRCIASDTDSIILNLSDYVAINNCKTRTEKLDLLNVFCKIIEKFISKEFDEIAIFLNSMSNNMHMKRENIGDRAIWRSKKNYIMNVWDSEGKRYTEPKLKMMGIETQKSSTPKLCRDALKETIRLIMNNDEETTRKYINQFKTKFMLANFEDISFPGGVNGLEKYQSPGADLFIKGTPFRVKGSLIYNNELVKRKLTKKYPKIQSKDKIKFCYLKLPNPLMQSVIAVPKYLPKEFELNKYIDYELMYTKTFLDPISSILNVIGWNAEKPNTLESFFD